MASKAILFRGQDTGLQAVNRCAGLTFDIVTPQRPKDDPQITQIAVADRMMPLR